MTSIGAIGSCNTWGQGMNFRMRSLKPTSPPMAVRITTSTAQMSIRRRMAMFITSFTAYTEEEVRAPFGTAEAWKAMHNERTQTWHIDCEFLGQSGNGHSCYNA